MGNIPTWQLRCHCERMPLPWEHSRELSLCGSYPRSLLNIWNIPISFPRISTRSCRLLSLLLLNILYSLTTIAAPYWLLSNKTSNLRMFLLTMDLIILTIEWLYFKHSQKYLLLGVMESEGNEQRAAILCFYSEISLLRTLGETVKYDKL